MEYRELYDDERNKVGKSILKGEKVPKGYYYNVVSISIENDEGKCLIQKRSEIKGGNWAFTSGHPKNGETSKEGIISEVKEELGIDISCYELIPYHTLKQDHSFVDFYHINMTVDLNDIILQEEEVEDVRFATIEEIEELINQNKFHDSHKIQFEKMKEYLENKNTIKSA